MYNMDKLKVQFPQKFQSETPCVKLSGCFYNIEAMNFKSDIIEFLNDVNSDCIVDICQVKYMDLTALNALIIAQREIEHTGKKLIIKTNLENPIFELLNLTKFKRHLNLNIAA